MACNLRSCTSLHSPFMAQSGSCPYVSSLSDSTSVIRASSLGAHSSVNSSNTSCGLERRPATVENYGCYIPTENLLPWFQNDWGDEAEDALELMKILPLPQEHLRLWCKNLKEQNSGLALITTKHPRERSTPVCWVRTRGATVRVDGSSGIEDAVCGCLLPHGVEHDIAKFEANLVRNAVSLVATAPCSIAVLTDNFKVQTMTWTLVARFTGSNEEDSCKEDIERFEDILLGYDNFGTWLRERRQRAPKSLANRAVAVIVIVIVLTLSLMEAVYNWAGRDNVLERIFDTVQVGVYTAVLGTIITGYAFGDKEVVQLLKWNRKLEKLEDLGPMLNARGDLGYIKIRLLAAIDEVWFLGGNRSCYAGSVGGHVRDDRGLALRSWMSGAIIAADGVMVRLRAHEGALRVTSRDELYHVGGPVECAGIIISGTTSDATLFGGTPRQWVASVDGAQL